MHLGCACLVATSTQLAVCPQIRYAVADAACLLAVLDSLAAAAPPREHVLEGTTTPQRKVSAASEPGAVLTDEHACVGAQEMQQQSSERPPAVAGENCTVSGPGGDGGETSSRIATAEVVRWWAERIQLSGHGKLVCKAPTVACAATLTLQFLNTS